MYKDLKVIDVHGHMSTPQEFSMFGLNLINLRKPNSDHPNPSDVWNRSTRSWKLGKKTGDGQTGG